MEEVLEAAFEVMWEQMEDLAGTLSGLYEGSDPAMNDLEWLDMVDRKIMADTRYVKFTQDQWAILVGGLLAMIGGHLNPQDTSVSLSHMWGKAGLTAGSKEPERVKRIEKAVKVLTPQAGVVKGKKRGWRGKTGKAGRNGESVNTVKGGV